MNLARALITQVPPGVAKVLVVVLVIGCAVVIVLKPLLGGAVLGALLFLVVTFRWPAFGLMASLLTLVLGQLVRIPVFGAESTMLPNDALIPLVVLAWALRRAVDGKPLLPTRPLGVPLVLFGGVLGLSLVAAAIRGNYNQRELLASGLYFVRWLEYVTLFFITRTIVRRQDVRRWLALLAGIAVLLALLGFLQLKVVPDFSRFVPQGWDPHIGRLLSTWFDPNFIAGFFAVATLVALAVLAERTPDWKLALAVTLICLGALVLTFSRSGYAGFIVGFGVLGVLRARHFVALGILACLAVFVFVPRVQERVIGVRTVDETAQFRLQSWRNALTVMADYPVLGVGYNTYRYVQVDYGFVKEASEHSAGGSDSSLLTLGVTAGGLGLITYALLAVVMLGAVFRVARTTPHSTTRALAYGLFASLIALLVHGQFVNGLFYPHLMEVQWVGLGLLFGVRDQEGATV